MVDELKSFHLISSHGMQAHTGSGLLVFYPFQCEWFHHSFRQQQFYDTMYTRMDGVENILQADLQAHPIGRRISN
jgi:hypothetical protein